MSLIEMGKGIKPGIIAGVLCGAIVWAVVMPKTHLFEEVPILQNFIAFLLGGLVVGLLTGLIFSISFAHLPSSSSTLKAVALSLVFWLVFITVGVSVAYFEILPHRTINLFEIARSPLFFIIFGVLLGFFWNKFNK